MGPRNRIEGDLNCDIEKGKEYKVLEIKCKNDSIWWYQECDENKGWFPADHAIRVGEEILRNDETINGILCM